MREILADDKLIRRIERVNVGLLCALTLGGWFFFSLRMAWGVLFGGLIAIVSFEILKWQLRRAFLGKATIPRKGGLFVTYYLRFLGVVFVIFAVIYYGWVHPIALVVGLSVVAISILCVGVQEFIVMLVRGER